MQWIISQENLIKKMLRVGKNHVKESRVDQETRSTPIILLGLTIGCPVLLALLANYDFVLAYDLLNFFVI